MAHTTDQKNKAQNLYVIEGKTVEDISKILKIPTQTLYRWRYENGWDNSLKQGGSLGMAIKLQESLMNDIRKAIENGNLTEPQTADAIYKTSKLIEKFLPKKTMLANIFNMLQDVTTYIRNLGDDKFVSVWVKYLPEISDFLRKKYNE